MGWQPSVCVYGCVTQHVVCLHDVTCGTCQRYYDRVWHADVLLMLMQLALLLLVVRPEPFRLMIKTDHGEPVDHSHGLMDLTDPCDSQ